MYFVTVSLLVALSPVIHSDVPPTSRSELGLTFGHTWNKRTDTVSVYFNISNSTFSDYRYYYYDLRSFASYGRMEYFPRQRLTDTHNSLNLIGLHEDDYVTCVSFVDEYGNVYKPRFTCYEFTLGEKVVGSHHGGSSGYLAPLLFAFAFVIHVFIAVVHHIKAKNYAHKLLDRFTDVDSKAAKKMLSVQHSLKQLDQPSVPASVQRRLSRVALGTDVSDGGATKKTVEDVPVYVIPQQSRRLTLGVMQTIAEQHP